MKCPSCPDTLLVMTDRQGVEIDYCPQCRGVWLDRGELDKLIERAATAPPASPDARQQRPNFVDAGHRGEYRARHDTHHSDRHGGRRKSWLSDIFD